MSKVNAFVDRVTSSCLCFVIVDGGKKPCTKKWSKFNVSNVRLHLQSHGLRSLPDAEGAFEVNDAYTTQFAYVTQRRGMQTLQQPQTVNEDDLDAEDAVLNTDLPEVAATHEDAKAEGGLFLFRNVHKLVCNFVASANLPFRVVMNEDFVKLFPFSFPADIAERRRFAAFFVKSARAKLEDALAAMRKRHRHITVAIDSGTVWRRYLAVVLLQPKGPPLLVALTHDSVFPNGRQSAENIAQHLEELLRTLLFGLDVVAFVGDNASNVQSALLKINKQTIEEVGAINGGIDDGAHEFDEVFETQDQRSGPQDDKLRNQWLSRGGYIKIRCLAHSVQLVVRDIIKDVFPNLEALCKRLRDDLEISQTVCETRWNSLYLLLKEIFKTDAQNPINDRDIVDKELRPALTALEPFFSCTMEIQKVGARTWDALLGLFHLHGFVSKNGQAMQKARYLFVARAEQMFSPAVLLVAYFSLTVRGSRYRSEL